MSQLVDVKVVKVHENATVPQYAKEEDAGFDFYSVESVLLKPGKIAVISTGLKMAIPEGKYLAIVPRSGLSLKTKIRVANSPGTIDSGYRGEVGIILENTGNSPYLIEVGDRIAQGILKNYSKAEFNVVDELPKSERGTGGFGHTGQ